MAVLSFARMKTIGDRRRQPKRRGGGARPLRVLADQWRTPYEETPTSPPIAGTLRYVTLARGHLLPLLLYLLLALFVTYPLVRHFGTVLPGDGRDAWQNYWDYWWLRTALAEGHNPYQTPLLYAPSGVPLYLHTLNLFNGLITLPLQITFGLTVAYNTVVILSLTLAAYCADLLVGFVARNRLAGFMGGVIYAFGSYHMAHLLGHTNLLASEWLPAYLLCLLAAGAATGRRRWWMIGAAIITLFLLTFCDWQYVVFAGLFTALYVLYTALARRTLAPLLVAALIGGVWLLLALPILLPTAQELRDTALTRPAVFGPERFSADLLSFVVPSPLHSWWGEAAERIGGRAVAPPVERAIFLGFLPLLLAACGLWWQRRRATFWALAALLFAVLALGPTLQIAGKERGSGIPLPYRLLQLIPGVNVSRVPARFGLLVTLCLAILAGLGLVSLARRFPALARPRVSVWLAPLLVAALLAEQLAVPYPLTAVQEPAFYRQLAQSAETGAVLELPFSLTRSTSLFGQTVHHRPIIGGYLSRPLAYPILDLPPFAEPGEQQPGGDIVAAPTAAAGNWVLRLSDVRWIVVLRADPKLNRDEITVFLGRYAEPTPLYEDAQMAVYRPLTPSQPLFLLRPTAGWHQPEPLPNKRRMRWLPWQAAVDAWSLSDTVQTGTLRFEAWSFNQPRRLVVSVDGVEIGRWLVAEPKRYEVPITLAPGQHQIELRTLDPPERPSRTVGGSDDRLISLGVAGMEIVPINPSVP